MGSCDQVLQKLEEAFGQPFALLDLCAGELSQVTANWLPIDSTARLGIIEEVLRRGQPEIIEDFAPLVLLAVPMPMPAGQPASSVALATFVTQPVATVDDMAAAAECLGVDPQVAYPWSQSQTVWPARAIEQLSQSLLGQLNSQQQNQTLRTQLTSMSQQLLQTFEELNLLHRLNEHLSIGNSDRLLADRAIEWLHQVLPAECLLALIEPPRTADTSLSHEETTPLLSTDSLPKRQWLTAGDCPLQADELDSFFDHLRPNAHESSILVDAAVVKRSDWKFPSVQQALCVPIHSGNQITGWLIALNHRPSTRANRSDTGEFGTAELNLLLSVAATLGMHSGNVQLFNEQEEFFEGMVHALSSAIDAKDPYTRGHSERVARIAVCLARHLGCTKEQLNTLYLGGLLHDIGKIGIKDSVLGKPGNLTGEEYQHIQLHPELGCQILKRVRRLEHVLPVVLHHHEAWDGTGYPSQLAGEQIPWLARIAAVADAFDAMASDRPYRTGMPTEQLDTIFRNGAGKQWDAQVISAFFAIRDEIDAVVRQDREALVQEELTLDVEQWNS